MLYVNVKEEQPKLQNKWSPPRSLRFTLNPSHSFSWTWNTSNYVLQIPKITKIKETTVRLLTLGQLVHCRLCWKHEMFSCRWSTKPDPVTKEIRGFFFLMLQSNYRKCLESINSWRVMVIVVVRFLLRTDSRLSFLFSSDSCWSTCVQLHQTRKLL